MVSLIRCSAQLSDYFQLHIENINIAPFETTVVLGENGSGKSALLALVAGDIDLQEGSRHVPETFAWVSVSQQLALIEAERQKDGADILDIIPVPTPAKDILLAEIAPHKVDPALYAHLCHIFSLTPLLERPFRALSSGETRKLLLANAILSKPKLLILDEPWDGLDDKATTDLQSLLHSLSADHTLLFVVNRLSEVPHYCKQLIVMHEGATKWQTKITDDLAEQITHVQQWQHMQQQTLRLPQADSERFTPLLSDPSLPLVKLTNAKVSYGGETVFSNLNWTINACEHWQLTGPNGSGKTCLLNLITGDHPQCYVNDINVFGMQRGSGESIWQIKQYIGYVSNGFHVDYRVNCSLLHVILSGFYDSIGLYHTPTDHQIRLAKQWLALLALETEQDRPFQSLSFGDQRLALIARAMVKHPALLILDEPCNGLDDINRLKVLALIELLASQGTTTVLYVNHHADDIIASISRHFSMLDYQLNDTQS
jgi:molybdate transport system ATP-binding protein